jgi:hypothetical protein
LAVSLYPVFADWAKRHGLGAAVDRFGPALPDQVTGFREQFERDLAKVQAGGPPIISAGRDDWYSGPSDADVHWPSLITAFEVQGWPAHRIASVDMASSTVVAHTPRPDRVAWDAKGLVVGYVQSGKTTNFTSVVAKLADIDYKMIIVLSGIHNGLRRQTQARLDEVLKDLNPDMWWTLTEETSDFKVPTYRASAALSSNKTMLAVVKKNVVVLRRLVRWLDTADGRAALQTARVLVIDDEADQASVATARINPLIRRLLALMPRCTYVGYTATPFANVFIDPSQDDLYPKSFILNLPRPDGYFGPEKIFGRDAVEGEDDEAAPDGYDMVRIVDEDEVSLLRPTGKEAAVGFAPTMTDDLVNAVHWFWLATAARRARGDPNHSTMLVHTSVKIDVHEAYRSPLLSLRRKALESLDAGVGSALEPWRTLWESESARVPAADWGRTQNTFEQVLAHLRAVVASTSVVLDNYRSQDRLDYTGDEAVVAIAVGGNTLSRGLTLEGLVVSLFVRGATAYDTLLQMGRWFGYRTGYEDLPRIWMTPSLEAAFRHLATVEHEMRDDIDRYQREALTPLEIAVRIRTHPALRITAKMGAAQPAYVSYAGRRMQTRYFYPDDTDWLEANLRAANVLVQEALGRGTHEMRDGVHVIRNVPVGLVKNFMADYLVHPDSPDLDPRLMTRYVDKQLEAEPPSLANWSVAVVPGSAAPVDIGGITLAGVVRSRLNDHNGTRADIKTLMSRPDRALDLELTSTQAQAAGEAELVRLRNEDQVYRDRGLLVLYPIDPLSEPIRSNMRPAGAAPARLPLAAARTVVGVGIVFPGDAQEKNRIQATHVAVDLSDVEREDLDDALDQDTEYVS